MKFFLCEIFQLGFCILIRWLIHVFVQSFASCYFSLLVFSIQTVGFVQFLQIRTVFIFIGCQRCWTWQSYCSSPVVLVSSSTSLGLNRLLGLFFFLLIFASCYRSSFPYKLCSESCLLMSFHRTYQFGASLVG